MTADLLSEERDECALVWRAQSENLPVEHRPDINPIALLGVKLTTAPRAAAAAETSIVVLADAAMTDRASRRGLSVPGGGTGAGRSVEQPSRAEDPHAALGSETGVRAEQAPAAWCPCSGRGSLVLKHPPLSPASFRTRRNPQRRRLGH